VRYGYRMIRVLLNREGWNWKVDKYLVYRLVMLPEDHITLEENGRAL
jgi:hypothetical protein